MHDYAIVDVFSERPLAGNPLAVVSDADDLTESQMGDIAAELQLSETTFVQQPTRPDADWRLRSFTPGLEEVGGAGHNALGAWWWLAVTDRAGAPGAQQELAGRVLPVTISADDNPVVSIDQGPASIDNVGGDPTHVLDALGLPTDAVGVDRPLVVGSVGGPAQHTVDRHRGRPTETFGTLRARRNGTAWRCDPAPVDPCGDRRDRRDESRPWATTSARLDNEPRHAGRPRRTVRSVPVRWEPPADLEARMTGQGGAAPPGALVR